MESHSEQATAAISLIDPLLLHDDFESVSNSQESLKWQKRPLETPETGPGKRPRIKTHFSAVTETPCSYWEGSYLLPTDTSAVPAAKNAASMHSDLVPYTPNAYITHSAPSLPISEEDIVFNQYLVDETVSPSMHDLPHTHFHCHCSTPIPGDKPFLVDTTTGPLERRSLITFSHCQKPSPAHPSNADDEICMPSTLYSFGSRFENDVDAVRPSDMGWRLDSEAQSPCASTRHPQHLLLDEPPSNCLPLWEGRLDRFTTASDTFASSLQLQKVDRSYPRIGLSGYDDLLQNTVMGKYTQNLAATPRTCPKANPCEPALAGLSVPLLEHQEQGLAWMVARETSNQKGGILADGMGLGKTIQALSLIAKRPSPTSRRHATLVVMPAGLISQWVQEVERLLPPAYGRVYVLHGNKGNVDFSTINRHSIVLTSFGTVASELRRKQHWQRCVAPISTREHHNLPILGPNSTWHRVILDEAQDIKNDRSRAALACCDIDATYRWCLTGTPVMNNLRELYSLLKFLRIQPFSALDVFNATFAARDDWGANQEGRAAHLQTVLGNILLRRTTSTIINGQPIVQLPPVRIENIHVGFNDMEQQLYAAVENYFQVPSLKAGAIRPSVTHMLTLLRRLQQACCHPFLIPDLQQVVNKVSEGERHRALNASSFAEKVVTRLQENKRSLGECPICFDAVKNPLIFWPCGHSICDKCFGKIFPIFPGSSSLYGDAPVRCPICREYLDPGKVTDYDTLMRYHYITGTEFSSSIGWYMPLEELLNPSSEQSEYPKGGGDRVMMNWFADDPSNTNVPAGYNMLSEPPRNPSASKKHTGHDAIVRQRHYYALSRHWISSSKIDKALEIVQQIRETGEGGKIIIFSQFTSLLDFLEIPLRQRRWTFCRYDGSMKPENRHQAVQEYVNNSECTVMLVSLRAGNSGLNLAIASHVIILDPSWNPSVEDQAVGRVYRIGQHKPVHVRRLLVPNTVEDRIQDLQEQKRNLTSCILEEGFTAQAAQPGRNDLAYILGFAQVTEQEEPVT